MKRERNAMYFTLAVIIVLIMVAVKIALVRADGQSGHGESTDHHEIKSPETTEESGHDDSSPLKPGDH